MERKKYILSLFLLICTLSLMASTYKKQIYEAYITGKMSNWKMLITQMEKEAAPANESILELINYQYGYIGWCIGTSRKDEARIYIEKMETLIDKLGKANYKPSHLAAYRSALYGFNIGLNKMKAPFLGPKSMEYAKKAMKTDPSNPFGYLLYANILYYTPDLFGGSKEDAMNHYLLALRKSEANREAFVIYNWNYLSLLTTIASAYYNWGENENAIIYLKKALQTEPGYQWVKNELYPKFNKNK